MSGSNECARVGVSLSEDGSRGGFRKAVFFFLNLDDGKSPKTEDCVSGI